jgi:hypothetical protein
LFRARQQLVGGHVVADCRAIVVTPHLAPDAKNRVGAIDERTTRDPGHAVSQIICKLIETVLGDGKLGKRLFLVSVLCFSDGLF